MDKALTTNRDGLSRLLPQAIVLTLAETERVGGGQKPMAPDGHPIGEHPLPDVQDPGDNKRIRAQKKAQTTKK
jgi:hypothetical protein